MIVVHTTFRGVHYFRHLVSRQGSPDRGPQTGGARQGVSPDHRLRTTVRQHLSGDKYLQTIIVFSHLFPDNWCLKT